MLRGFILPFFVAASPAVAQEAEIVVTGRGLGAALGDDVYDVVVLNRERLTGSASNRLDELLKEVPGFQLFRRSDARSANPTSQGATLRALGGNASSRALLVLDGVPQTDPFGGWISWPAYDPRRLGEVRVVRGGGSGANGSGALAGTIELSSARPSELRGAGGSFAYGSRDSLDAFVGAGLTLGAGFLSLSASYARGDGFIPVVAEQRGPVDRPSPYEQGSLAVRGVAPIGASTEIQVSGSFFRDKRERGTAFSDIRTAGADASVRLVGRRWSALAYVQTRDFYNSFASVNAARTSVSRASEQYDVPSTGTGARVEFRPLLGPVELRVGGDWRATEGETRELFNFQNGIGTRQRIAGGETQTLGGFAEAAWQVGPLMLTGGGRIDRWWIDDGKLHERVIANGAVLTHLRYADRSGWEPTGRAGAAWLLREGLTLRAASYLGWRLPTLNELYRPFRVGNDTTRANAALEPERLKGIEAGIDFRPASAARIGVTLFANRLEDGIANVTLSQGAGGTIRERQNIDAIVTRGIELDGRVALGRWSLSGGYSYADAEVKADGPALPLNGLRPAQTPKHSFAATAAWASEAGARASLTGRYVGSQFEDDLNEQELPDALTFDASAAWPLTRTFAIEARAEISATSRWSPASAAQASWSAQRRGPSG
ncbi:MAG TPA: TonB-dependent receptor [Allosphingosinicella sp.]|uniref:TonB-dependent receptor n=1 Tax=Allosphingosinicella sp. TaxID=2823234 RepID=UPI002ED85E64